MHEILTTAHAGLDDCGLSRSKNSPCPWNRHRCDIRRDDQYCQLLHAGPLPGETMAPRPADICSDTESACSGILIRPPTTPPGAGNECIQSTYAPVKSLAAEEIDDGSGVILRERSPLPSSQGSPDGDAPNARHDSLDPTAQRPPNAGAACTDAIDSSSPDACNSGAYTGPGGELADAEEEDEHNKSGAGMGERRARVGRRRREGRRRGKAGEERTQLSKEEMRKSREADRLNQYDGPQLEGGLLFDYEDPPSDLPLVPLHAPGMKLRDSENSQGLEPSSVTQRTQLSGEDSVASGSRLGMDNIVLQA